VQYLTDSKLLATNAGIHLDDENSYLYDEARVEPRGCGQRRWSTGSAAAVTTSGERCCAAEPGGAACSCRSASRGIGVGDSRAVRTDEGGGDRGGKRPELRLRQRQEDARRLDGAGATTADGTGGDVDQATYARRRRQVQPEGGGAAVEGRGGGGGARRGGGRSGEGPPAPGAPAGRPPAAAASRSERTRTTLLQ
jgi:hypothetical protein